MDGEIVQTNHDGSLALEHNEPQILSDLNTSTKKDLQNMCLHQTPSSRTQSSMRDSKGEREDRVQGYNIYWGNVRPLFRDQKTGVPLFAITKGSIVPYIMNILNIMAICWGLPYLLSSTILHKENPACRVSPHSSSQIQSTSTSNFLCALELDQLLFYACIVWSSFQFFFLTLLTISNPGYSNKRQVTDLRGQSNVRGGSGKKLLKGSYCVICSSEVDNFVFHCQSCDICCEGFSHHCNLVNKCIGSSNRLIWIGYGGGYVMGLLFVLILQFRLWLK